MNKTVKTIFIIFLIIGLGTGVYFGYQYLDKKNELPKEEGPSIPSIDEINETKEFARQMSIKNYAVAVMSAYETYFMNHGVAPVNFSQYRDLVFYSGNTIDCEDITYDAGKITMKNCKIQDKTYSYQDGKVIIDDVNPI